MGNDNKSKNEHYDVSDVNQSGAGAGNSKGLSNVTPPDATPSDVTLPVVTPSIVTPSVATPSVATPRKNDLQTFLNRASLMNVYRIMNPGFTWVWIYLPSYGYVVMEKAHVKEFASSLGIPAKQLFPYDGVMSMMSGIQSFGMQGGGGSSDTTHITRGIDSFKAMATDFINELEASGYKLSNSDRQNFNTRFDALKSHSIAKHNVMEQIISNSNSQSGGGVESLKDKYVYLDERINNNTYSLMVSLNKLIAMTN